MYWLHVCLWHWHHWILKFLWDRSWSLSQKESYTYVSQGEDTYNVYHTYMQAKDTYMYKYLPTQKRLRLVQGCGHSANLFINELKTSMICTLGANNMVYQQFIIHLSPLWILNFTIIMTSFSVLICSHWKMLLIYDKSNISLLLYYM